MSHPTPAGGLRMYRTLTVLALGLFTVGTNAVVIAGLLPDIADAFDATQTQASYAITIYAAAVAIAAPTIATLLPRLSRTTLMACGAVVVAIGGVAAATAPTLSLFIAGRLLAGIGGAALVPAASAAAAAMSPPDRQGRALAFVTFGFSFASALGAPLGTAIGSAGGWRLPLYLLSSIALLTAALIALWVRDVPLEQATGFRDRLRPLRDIRLIAALLTHMLVTAGFNAVYIFSAAIVSAATGGNADLLATLLLIFGVAGLAGNVAGGAATDWFGNRPTATITLAGLMVVFLLLPLLSTSFTATAILFGAWGILAIGAVVPVQHRVLAIDPDTSGVAVSWFSTAMYLGIAVAPMLGGIGQAIAGLHEIPTVAAIVIAAALICFQFSYRQPRQRPLAESL